MGRRVISNITLPSITVSQNSTNTTAAFDFSRCTGTVIVDIDLTGTCDITVKQQISLDGGMNWKDVKDASGNAVGAVATTITADRTVSYSPVLGPLARFHVTENNTGAVTALVFRLLIQEEAM